MTLNIISLGAGVQLTTMALMAAHGEITPMPDAAIFADTGWEPKAVYDHLAWLSSGNVLPFPVHVVSAGNLRDKVLSGGYSDVPFFTDKGIGRRQCTHQFKLRPLRREIRTRFEATRKNPVTVWIGISKDEVFRRKEADVQYIKNRWPLLEMEMRRANCLEWLARNGYPKAPRSACNGCPFRNKEDWKAVKAVPDEWDATVADDHAIRSIRPGVTQYMHSSLKPLDKADLETLEDKGQLNMFNNECEGMCGV